MYPEQESPFEYGDPYIEWSEANEANDDGRAVAEAERAEAEVTVSDPPAAPEAPLNWDADGAAAWKSGWEVGWEAGFRAAHAAGGWR